MPVYWFEDASNVIYNRVTITGGGIGSGVPAYNAVIDVSFVDTGILEPVTLQEAKDWCRVDIADDDTLITALITAARIICENASNLSFIPRTVTAVIHNGLGNFTLPYGPLVTLTSIADVDLTVIDITTYFLRDAYGNDMTVVYTAGYAVLPKNLKNAMLAQIAWMYEFRGDVKLATALCLESSLILKQVRRL